MSTRTLLIVFYFLYVIGADVVIVRLRKRVAEDLYFAVCFLLISAVLIGAWILFFQP